MKDRNGDELKIGDRVYLECVVTQINDAQRDGCNTDAVKPAAGSGCGPSAPVRALSAAGET